MDKKVLEYTKNKEVRFTGEIENNWPISTGYCQQQKKEEKRFDFVSIEKQQGKQLFFWASSLHKLVTITMFLFILYLSLE